MPRCTPTGWELKCHRLADQRPNAEVSEDQSISPTNMAITSIYCHLYSAHSVRQSCDSYHDLGPISPSQPSFVKNSLIQARSSLLRCIQQGDQTPSFLIPCIPCRLLFCHPIIRDIVVVPHSKMQRHSPESAYRMKHSRAMPTRLRRAAANHSTSGLGRKKRPRHNPAGKNARQRHTEERANSRFNEEPGTTPEYRVLDAIHSHFANYAKAMFQWLQAHRTLHDLNRAHASPNRAHNITLRFIQR